MARSGLTARITKDGNPVLRVHYSADTRKDPRTPEGFAWLERAAQGYKGGMQSADWRQEMEIVYGAKGGQPLFPYFEQEKPWIVCDPFPIQQVPGVKFYGTYDHGNVHKSSYQVHAMVPGGKRYTVWEFAEAMVPLQAIAEVIKGHPVTLQRDGRSFDGNPYAGREVVKYADPQIFERRGKLTEADFASIGDRFRDQYQVYFQKGAHGGQLTCAEMLIGDLWLEPGQPKYQIFSTCTNLLWELPRLRHKTVSPLHLRTKGPAEGLVDKDDDSWDSLCHFLRLFPVTVAPRQERQMVGTFAYAQKQIKTRMPLRNSYARV